jgi:hypothetical protein
LGVSQRQKKRRTVTTLSKLLRHKAILSVWLGAFGLFAVFESPMTIGTGVLLLTIGLMVPAVVLLLWRDHPPTVAEVLHRVEASGTKL